MMGIVEDVQAYLAEADLVDDSEWPSVRRRVHDGSDRLVIITEDGGPEPETPSPAGIGETSYREPAVQVRVRAESWNGDAAHAQAQAIFAALHGLLRVEMGSGYYERVKAQTSGPVFIGFDDRGRPEFTTSFRAVVQQ